VILSNIPSSPTSLVPGLVGVRFLAGGTNNFFGPYGSETGSRWVVLGFADTPGGSTSVLLHGQGTGPASLVAREGMAAPFDASRTLGLINLRSQINDAGRVVFVSNLTGSTLDDEVVFRYQLSAYVDTPFREGMSVGWTPGVTYGGEIDSVSLLADGRVAARTSLAGTGVTSSNNFAVCLGGTLMARKGTPIAGGAPVLTFEFERMAFAPGGTPWMVVATDSTNPSNDAFVAVDGAVALREGGTVPGVASSVRDDGIRGIYAAPSGAWFIRGTSNDGTDWVVRNGSLMSATGSDITPLAPSGELFDDIVGAVPIFGSYGYAFACTNASGRLILGGYTNNPDTTRRWVVVADESRVVMRMGDGVDLNGNGAADDGVFVRQLVEGMAFLADDGRLYLTVQLGDSAGDIAGQALVVLDTNPPPPVCVADFDDGSGTGTPDGGVTIDDLIFYLGLFEAGDVGADVDDGSSTGVRDGGVTIDDLIYYLVRFEAGC
jgi:hypothetical protein